jgi:UDP:flavonoid glycosyltransferase YjiC (YdhE family)
MRVAFALWPASAHLYPFVPLAWALRAAGHDVVFTSHPSLGPVVAASGLPFIAMCDEADMPEPAGPTAAYPEARREVARITEALRIPKEHEVEWGTVSQAFLPSIWDFTPFQADPAEPMPAMDSLVNLFKEWRPDLVIWDPCMPGAAVAARAVGAAQCRQSGTDYNGWFIELYEELSARPGAPEVPNPFAETLRGMAERYGVPLDRETLFGQWTIDVVPPGMNFPVNTRRLPMRLVSHTAQSPAPPWLYPLPKRPRVALSLGMSVRKYVPASDWTYVRMLLDALGGLDIEVIATLDEAQLAQVGTVPENVRTVDFIPLDTLIPTCQLLIHHGGIVIDFLETHHEDPNAGDGSKEISFPRYKLAPVTGGYVTGFGAGSVLDLSRPSIEEIRRSVTAALTDPAYLDGARRLRQDLMTAPSPNDLVATLESLAAAR